MKLIIDEKTNIFANPIKPLITESQVGCKSVKEIRFTGMWMESEIKNKNGRKYPQAEIIREVTRYQSMISERRALGELEHPESASVDLERVAYLCEKLYMDDKDALGQGLVLQDMPMGKIVATLLLNGIKIGLSSRGLGDLIEEGTDPVVKNFQFVCADVIHDPSAPRAFINGVLESKEFVLADGVICERSVERLEQSISKLPKKDVDGHLARQIMIFLEDISRKK